jgi:alpha-N-arabinofuranosidase
MENIKMKPINPDNPAIVFLVAGQSNAGGCGVLSPEIHEVRGEHIKNPLLPGSTAQEVGLPIDAGDYTHSFIWVPEHGLERIDPRRNLDPCKPDTPGHGMELPVVRELEQLFSENDIFVVKLGPGNTSLHNQWNPERDDGLYATLLGYYRNTMETLIGIYPEIRVVGLYWDQGETDGKDGKHNEYVENLEHFIAAVRHDTGVPDLRIFIRKHIFDWPNIDAIIAAQEQVVANNPLYYLLDIDLGERQKNYEAWCYSPGNRHISSKGFIALKNALFDGPLQGIKTMLPTSIPIFTSNSHRLILPEHHSTVTVFTDVPARTYSRMIFGGFLEHFNKQVYGGIFDPGSPLSDGDCFRLDALAALKELQVPIVRWPGGCYVSGYHWKDGVGPERRPTDDMAWGVRDPHTFGTDEFVHYCRKAGWEPYICNNAGNGTIEEMQDWVRYCNCNEDDPRRRVRIWSIGNENWGAHEIGHKPIKEWAPFVRKAAMAMKAVDPDIILTAAAIPTREWLTPLLEEAGEYLDYISIHRYWLGIWNENVTPDYVSCIANCNDAEAFVTQCVDLLEETGYRGKIRIAFDEWNLRGWYHPGFPRKDVQDYDNPEVQRLVAARDDNLIASQYTMADALFTASFLNSCLRHSSDVGMANIAPLVNTRGPLYVHPEGIVKRTHYHALWMYANLLHECVANMSVSSDTLAHGNESVALVDSVATVDRNGNRWAVALLNRHPSEKVSCSLQMGDSLLEGVYSATVLTGDSADAYNDREHPERVIPERVNQTFRNGITHLPPHSLTILKVTR